LTINLSGINNDDSLNEAKLPEIYTKVEAFSIALDHLLAVDLKIRGTPSLVPRCDNFDGPGNAGGRVLGGQKSAVIGRLQLLG